MEKNCKQCGKGFVYIPSKKCRRKYCSKECSSAHEKSISSTGKIRAKNIYLKAYGITIHDYEHLLRECDFKCPICSINFQLGYGNDIIKKGEVAHVDHCHKTGKIRGLLCFNCNTSIGGGLDSVEKLKNAIHYLTNNDLTIGQIYEVSFLDHIEGATKPLPCVIYGKLIKMNEDSLVIAGWIGSDNLENSTYWTIVKSTITNIKSLF
jgi:hypothetical protein